MKRFILLTFGFLGWAFYEMSGGADFEAASDRMARLNPAPAVSATSGQDAHVTIAAAEAGDPVDTDPPESESVTRVSLNLTSVQSPEEPADTAVAPAPTAANIDPESGVAVNTDTTVSSADTPAIIPSLITPNDAGTNVLTTSSGQGDIRTVSGNRVNVRGGPGTDFGVVFTLVRGDAVEVIQDNGDGWVLMRSLDAGGEGWMADFLLDAG